MHFFNIMPKTKYMPDFLESSLPLPGNVMYQVSFERYKPGNVITVDMHDSCITEKRTESCSNLTKNDNEGCDIRYHLNG